MLHKPSVVTLAWAAGVTESEGSIIIGRSKRKGHLAPRYQMSVSIANTDKAGLEYLQFEFGGGSIFPLQKPKKKTHTQCWMWNLAGREASEFLSLILPYMVFPTKREQAALALEFREILLETGTSGSPLTKNAIDLRHAYYEQMQILKQEVVYAH